MKTNNKPTAFLASTSKQLTIMVIIAIATLAILVTVYMVNGSQKEDAWLYIFSAWLIVFPAIELYFKKKKEDNKDT